jgi:hypothetical protein
VGNESWSDNIGCWLLSTMQVGNESWSEYRMLIVINYEIPRIWTAAYCNSLCVCSSLYQSQRRGQRFYWCGLNQNSISIDIDDAEMWIDFTDDEWVHWVSAAETSHLVHGCFVWWDELLKLGWDVIWMCWSVMCGWAEIRLTINAKFVLVEFEKTSSEFRASSGKWIMVRINDAVCF